MAGEQVDFSLNGKDWTRIIWTFVMAAGAVLVALAADWFQSGGELNWKVWAVAAVAAGWSAVKNFVLADTSTLK